MKRIQLILIPVLILFITLSGQAAVRKNKLNFDDVEVLSIIKLMSKVTGKSFVFNNRVLKGKKITLLSEQEFTAKEAYQIFEAFLKVNDLSALVEGKVIRIVQSKEARSQPAPIYSEDQRLSNEVVVTRVIPVKNANVKTLKANLKPLISKHATLLAIPDLNALILRDTKKNTNQFAKLVEMFDQMDDPVLSVSMEIVPVINADANELSTLINKIFTTVVPKGKTSDNKLKITADKRTNNIIIIGKTTSLEKIKQLVSQLDSKDEVDIENITILSLDIDIIPIKNGSAQNIAGLVSKIFSGALSGAKKGKKVDAQKVKIYGYERTNNLVAVAHPKILKKIREVVKQLDTLNVTDHENIRIVSLNLEIYPVKNADASDIAGLLTKMFSPPSSGNEKAAKSTNKLRVFADKRTNSLILIGFPKTLDKVKTIVAQLDGDLNQGERKAMGNIRVYRLKNANAESIAEVLQKVSQTFKDPQETNSGNKQKTSQNTKSSATIIPDKPSNSLVIYADENNFRELESVLEKLDIVRPQVFIQALIMEVRLDKSLELGVEWQNSSLNGNTLITAGGVGSTGGPKSITTTPSGNNGAILGIIGTPITFAGNDYASFDAFIKAYQQDTEIDILSNPKILTLNNEEAEIKIAEIIPTTGSVEEDSSTGDKTTTIEYKEVGLSLKIIPQINANESIELQIEQTSSNIIEGYTGAYDEGAITTLNRSIKTKVNVQDGQTVALGGLINDETTEITTQTPCLGDIPILGWLFKTKSTDTTKTNLLIFITPSVIRSREEIIEVTNEAKARLKSAINGRFRIDVTSEFDIPVLNDAEKEILADEEDKRLEEEKTEGE